MTLPGLSQERIGVSMEKMRVETRDVREDVTRCDGDVTGE
jgi:hypothetical protein